MNSKRWLISPLLTPQADERLSAFHPVLRQVLFNRGYSTDAEARAYLSAKANYSTDPFQLTGMEVAVRRIRSAIEGEEKIAIYGDYDVDGVTSTTLLVEIIRKLGGIVQEYIPNRFDEGYGLNSEALDMLISADVGLVITVDCGIRSNAEAEHASERGLDLIITDHHQPGEMLPEALAIINPKQIGDTYLNKELAGVGIAYKLAEGLAHDFSSSALDLDAVLDLVALGTVADLAPLTGENRLLVRRGLANMRQTARQGLFSLAAVAELNLEKVNATNIGFVLGPRLNAAGRLDSALAAYELLLTTDVKKAGELAQQLELQNRERQALTQRIQQQAEAIILSEEPGSYLSFAVHPDFQSGIVGLAAARLVDIYYRPVIVGQEFEATTRCSCRSIPEFHITNALDQCSDLLLRYGGHAAAAGFTVRNENLEALKDRLKNLAAEELKFQDLRPTLSADGTLSFSDLTPNLLNQLEYLQPTGYGNPDAVFVSRGVQVKSARTVGADGRHLKLTLSDSRVAFDAIAFRLGHLLPSLSDRVDIMYSFEKNEYNGREYMQLNIRDIQ